MNTEAKPKRQLTPEHKAKMAAGREAAKAQIKLLRETFRAAQPPEYGTAPGMKEALRAQRMENAVKAERLQEAAVGYLAPGHRVANPPVVRHSNSTEPEFPGLTTKDCCDNCGPNCAISGDVCVHPYKGGLHAKHMMAPEIFQKFQRAKRQLSVQAAENRNQ